MYLITQRSKVTGDGQRSRPCAYQRDLLAVLRKGPLRHERQRIFSIIRGNALESANCNRFFFDTAAATGRFTWSVARSSENTRKHVRVPVDHVSLGVFTRCDQANVLRYRCMRGTRVLAVDNFVKILRILYVSWFQFSYTLPRFRLLISVSKE